MREGLKEFTVPKDRQGVAVHFGDGAVVDGVIFLDHYPEEPSVHRRMVAFLEEDTPFFPLIVEGRDATEFINKKNVRMVEIECLDDADPQRFPLALMHLVDIAAVFNDGSALNGRLLSEVPVEKARLSDCLNQPGSFLSLKGNGAIFYLNKAMLRKVLYAEQA